MSFESELKGGQFTAKEKLLKIADLLERSGIDAEEIGRIERVNVYQGSIKNGDGESELVNVTSVMLSPSWAEEPQFPVVQPAKPTIVKPVPSKPKIVDATVTVILPDPQIGYRRLVDGTMLPMHDEKAMNLCLQMMRFIRPDKVVNLGDFIDLPEWSAKFLILPEFVLTTQPSIDRAHKFLAEQRAVVGDSAEMVLIAGNHDARLPMAITRNAISALRLKRANLPESFPVLSMGYLLRLDELKVKYLGAYPAHKYKIAKGGKGQTPLYAIHGDKLDVAKVAKSERQSFVQGHIHRIALHSETYEVGGEREQVVAFSPGCLCRVDGYVPSTKSAVNDDGIPVTRFESWQQGMAVITETKDGFWSLEMVSITDGKAIYRGRVFTSDGKNK
jgi:hypothetical protein